MAVISSAGISITLPQAGDHRRLLLRASRGRSAARMLTVNDGHVARQLAPGAVVDHAPQGLLGDDPDAIHLRPLAVLGPGGDLHVPQLAEQDEEGRPDGHVEGHQARLPGLLRPCLRCGVASGLRAPCPAYQSTATVLRVRRSRRVRPQNVSGASTVLTIAPGTTTWRRLLSQGTGISCVRSRKRYSSP